MKPELPKTRLITMSSNHSETNIRNLALILPTLGQRGYSLPFDRNELSESSQIFVVLVCPKRAMGQMMEADVKFDLIIHDEGKGLSGAILKAIQQLPEGIDFFTWIADDDFVRLSGLRRMARALEADLKATLAYGDCNYLNEDGGLMFTNKLGGLIGKGVRHTPMFVSQPATLYRLGPFLELGQSWTKYKYAFDFDILLGLFAKGDALYLPETVASYRWHKDAITVRKRWSSSFEAALIRGRHREGAAKLFDVFEPFLIVGNVVAGSGVSFLAKLLSLPSVKRVWPNTLRP